MEGCGGKEGDDICLKDSKVESREEKGGCLGNHPKKEGTLFKEQLACLKLSAPRLQKDQTTGLVGCLQAEPLGMLGRVQRSGDRCRGVEVTDTMGGSNRKSWIIPLDRWNNLSSKS